ncbi:hypothetical protein HBI56_225540 [Parastagonospora nodorum]|uniref:Uncharacterized protein n=1 Tax=Phaeosphaeria nodorum (strain SN15 / ATCC MYA-4574 / FGSC 10173) TaxID=321614 RepID=A0A7U2ID25_PHANO|nr:hypothetical protein HBH56_239160 [Parastagonospora nodorum]QRD07612.1 hypothetical protein JI435_162970 [Parastagonospora nodorum SN15]KAH3921594.1 hypothetical protein HBH54_236880 [Parastagonospora nodorum]KAH3939741.1 hypothetical protein HBH53_228800 [Parastagonospora nodorum]KAH3957935.1 hypothetical protein HBH51_217350 [Parastagonospora nodorum]
MPDYLAAFECDAFIESNTQLARELSTERSDRDERLPRVGVGTPPLSWPDSYIASDTQIARELDTANQLGRCSSPEFSATGAIPTTPKARSGCALPCDHSEKQKQCVRVISHVQHPDIKSLEAELVRAFRQANRRLSASQAHESVKHWILHFACKWACFPETTECQQEACSPGTEMRRAQERSSIVFNVRIKAIEMRTYFDNQRKRCSNVPRQLEMWSHCGSEG